MSDENMKFIINEFNKYTQFSEIAIEKIVDVNIGYAYKIAEFCYENNYKISPLRKSFDYLKKIQRTDKSWNEKRIEFYLLKPRLAMIFSKKQIPKDIYDVIITAMSLVDVADSESKNLKNFEYFIYFFESIIAYHKFLGGS